MRPHSVTAYMLEGKVTTCVIVYFHVGAFAQHYLLCYQEFEQTIGKTGLMLWHLEVYTWLWEHNPLRPPTYLVCTDLGVTEIYAALNGRK